MRKVIISLGLLIILSSFVSATIQIFQPGADNGTDTRPYEGSSDGTYGTGIYGYVGNSGGRFRSLENWNFTCSSFVGQTVTGVNLSLNWENIIPAGETIHIYPMNQSWDEMALTWNNCGGGGCIGWYNDTWDINIANTSYIIGWVNFTLTPTWLNNECAKPANQRYGIIIKTLETSGAPNFFSSDASSPNQPILYVEYSTETDTTPPILLNLNCTSCNIPYGDIIQPYETGDTTPTFSFSTNENGWCAIGVSNINYTTMGASRNCTTGEGAQSHICTLTNQDKFANVGANYAYISCKDSNGNEGNSSDHLKSNSGPIWMEIQGAVENEGDNAIQLGIESSEIWPSAVYDDKRISARNLANNQFTGIFDKVAVNGNKRWAFNYVSAGESQITGLFNLTPVLYVLQMQNQTNETITEQVGKLINSTWP